MYRLYGAELYTFDPVNDPPELERVDHFGEWLYVYRNPQKGRINPGWREGNKSRISVDPGGKIKDVLYNVGNGDVFYLGPGLSSRIRRLLYAQSYLQSVRDKEVNEDLVLSELAKAYEVATKARYTAVCFIIS